MADVTHHYRTTLSWSGSTGSGYRFYDRSHRAEAIGPTQALHLSADAAFGGDSGLLNPEQLVVAAAASCQLLSFLAVAARARLDVVDYRDDAVAVMPEDDPPIRITRIELHPKITLASGERPRPDEARLHHLSEVAHRECFIANTLRSELTVRPSFRWIS